MAAAWDLCLVQDAGDATKNQCVECKSAQDCGKSDTCSTTTHKCVPKSTTAGCQKDAECKKKDAAKPFCSLQKGECVECRGNVDCATIGRKNAVCRSSVCIGDETTDCVANGKQCPNLDKPVCSTATKVCEACNAPDLPATDTCPPSLECHANGRCETPGTAGICSTNADCQTRRRAASLMAKSMAA